MTDTEILKACKHAPPTPRNDREFEALLSVCVPTKEEVAGARVGGFVCRACAEAAIRAAVEEEREACALLAEGEESLHHTNAAAIRVRGAK